MAASAPSRTRSSSRCCAYVRLCSPAGCPFSGSHGPTCASPTLTASWSSVAKFNSFVCHLLLFLALHVLVAEWSILSRQQGVFLENIHGKESVRCVEEWTGYAFKTSSFWPASSLISPSVMLVLNSTNQHTF